MKLRKFIFFAVTALMLSSFQCLYAQNASFPLSTTGGFTINPQNREESRAFFNAVFNASEGTEINWTGDVAFCQAGTTSSEFKDAVLIRLNYFRAMAGVPANVTFTNDFNAMAQEAALIMSANDELSHFPPDSWDCFSFDGSEAAASSNLSIRRSGWDAVFGQMQDNGESNQSVGHRRWILYPQTQIMGTGDIPDTTQFDAANALWVFDSNYFEPRPSTREEFVAWPPPGNVPFQVVFPRWSFSFPDADFSSATVTMLQGRNSVPVTIESFEDGAGENTLVWVPYNLNPNSKFERFPQPSSDTTYTVAVNNVMIRGSPRNFSYNVNVIDPSITGPDSVFPSITGPSKVSIGNNNNFQFSTINFATGYQVRQSPIQNFTYVEGAENGFTEVNASISEGYSGLSTQVKASGISSFYLAHPTPEDQILVLERVIIPSATSTLSFSSRLGYATEDQIARVQISLNNGITWQDIYAQEGTDDPGEFNFNRRSISLSDFTNRSIIIRFNYSYTRGGFYYPQTDDNVGWFIDNITVSDATELIDSTTIDLGITSSFDFLPPASGIYALEVRGIGWESFPLEFGPAHIVQVIEAEANNELIVDGSGVVVGENIRHPSGNVFDQVLLTSQHIKLKARAGRITRASFMDHNLDIVQVEFSGAGTFTINLDPNNFTPARFPPLYNQQVKYVTGTASIVIEGADASTFFSVFTVGKINAVNQALFRSGTYYDAQADIKLLEVVNSVGFGGMQLANAVFSGSNGKVGVDSRDVPIAVRLTIGDIDASGDATPYLLFGKGSFTTRANNSGLRITGGDLLQSNGASIVAISEARDLTSQDNYKSDGTWVSRKEIRGTFDFIDKPDEIYLKGYAPNSLLGKTYEFDAFAYNTGELSLTFTFNNDTSGKFKMISERYEIDNIDYHFTNTGRFNYRVDSRDPNKAYLTLDIVTISVDSLGITLLNDGVETVADEIGIELSKSMEIELTFFNSVSGKFYSTSTLTDNSLYEDSGKFKEL